MNEQNLKNINVSKPEKALINVFVYRKYQEKTLKFIIYCKILVTIAITSVHLMLASILERNAMIFHLVNNLLKKL